MDDLTVIFEEQSTHLRAVAYRLAGWVHEADDAFQETWLRLSAATSPMSTTLLHLAGRITSRDTL